MRRISNPKTRGFLPRQWSNSRQELNELKATGVYPLAELSATSRDKESERGPRMTAQIVAYHPIHDPLFQARVSHDEIWGFAQWMSSPPRLDLTPSLVELGSGSFLDEYCRDQ
ncbi:hypothetical protein LB504_005941 [Fusarium proliferatum]|nr:hypothetical protein LB504_005941 [Fusarium proliferatum]